MRIQRLNLNLQTDHNRAYNKAVAPLVGDILQTEHEGPIGYVQAQPSTVRSRGWKPNPAVAKEVTEEYTPPGDQTHRFSFDDLGEYERVVFSCLVWGEYSTYVLTGEMGAGKTSLMKLMLGLLRADRGENCKICTVCNPVIIHLNFNEGFNSKETTELLELFRTRLYNSLRKQLRPVFRENALVAPFLDALRDPTRSAYDDFDPFLQAYEEDTEWDALTEADRANKLFKFIDDSSSRLYVRLSMMMALLRFVREFLRPDPACLVLLFDNIDSILAEAQYDILVEILALQDIAKVRSLVSLRRSTFEKLNNQAAYSFGCIEHQGPDIPTVLTKRLTYYLDNWQKLANVRVLGERHARALKARVQYALSTAEDPLGSIRRITHLAGASVRHALYTMERAFINSTIRFDEDPHYRDELFRAILVAGGEAGYIELDDPCVANIFAAKPSGEFSFLNLRILQLVKALEHSAPQRNILSLLAMLKATGDWDTPDVMKALNYLLNMRRPLIWVDGKSSYGSVAEMQSADDTVYLTEAGFLYLREMIGDLAYLQEALMSLTWEDADDLPRAIDLKRILERFRAIRACLRHIGKTDFGEASRFTAWLQNRKGTLTLEVRLITNIILERVSNAVLNILAQWENEEKYSAEEELRAWLSLIIEGLNSEESLGHVPEKLVRAKDRYEEYLRQSSFATP